MIDVSEDPYPVIQRVLETSWALWTDPKVRRGLKVAAFSENVIMNVSMF